MAALHVIYAHDTSEDMFLYSLTNSFCDISCGQYNTVSRRLKNMDKLICVQ